MAIPLLNIPSKSLTFYVYQFYCLGNNKKYIGITRNIKQRLRNHKNCKSEPTKYLYNARNKYGWDSFEFKVLKEFKTIDEATEAEKYYIEKYNTIRPNGMNMTLGGDGSCGYQYSDEQRKKISDANKGKKPSTETKKKMSLARKGKAGTKHTKLFKKKMSDMRNGSNNPASKLNEGQVIKIRSEYNKNISYRELGDKYNVGAGTILNIINRNSWVNI